MHNVMVSIWIACQCRNATEELHCQCMFWRIHGTNGGADLAPHCVAQRPHRVADVGSTYPQQFGRLNRTTMIHDSAQEKLQNHSRAGVLLYISLVRFASKHSAANMFRLMSSAFWITSLQTVISFSFMDPPSNDKPVRSDSISDLHEVQQVNFHKVSTARLLPNSKANFLAVIRAYSCWSYLLFEDCRESDRNPCSRRIFRMRMKLIMRPNSVLAY